jgi:hypothetical protein
MPFPFFTSQEPGLFSFRVAARLFYNGLQADCLFTESLNILSKPARIVQAGIF